MNDSQRNDQQDLKLAQQLRQAVRSQAVPPYLEARIRNTIHSTERKPSWRVRLMPVAAVLVLCLAAGVAYQLGHLRFTTGLQESYIASVSSRVASLMSVGLGDHIHCSVFRKFPKNVPPVEELEQNMGQEYRELIPIVRKHVPEEFRMVIAHECRYHGRKFVHLSLKKNSQLLSLIIARKGAGESFETEKLVPALVQSGIPFYRDGVQRFEIASFESRDHLAYFVSDLNGDQNMQLMLAIAPQVKGLLQKIES